MTIQTVVTVESPSDNDIAIIHAFLLDAYWSLGIPREVVERACAHSVCAIARDERGELIGFARAVTDRATFAWLADVFVLPAHRSNGIARTLVQTLRSHGELRNLRRWLLGTKDAHGVYEPLGFTVLNSPESFMQIRNAHPFSDTSGQPASAEAKQR